MRYRGLDADGDMVFGRGSGEWLVDSPETVAQAVRTRLGLVRGEYFLDATEGTPWATEILGVRTRPTYDRAIRGVILGTLGVLEITAYASQLIGRDLSVQATVDTVYGGSVITFGVGTNGAGEETSDVAGILDFSSAAQSGFIPLI